VTLTLDRVSVWLPGRGIVLHDLTAELAGVVVVTGRTGTGSTTLLQALSGTLPPGTRTAGRISGPTPVVLDQPLTETTPAQRPARCAAIRAHSATGAVVVWAEHLLEEALPYADQVLELTSHGALLAPAENWSPRTVPAPPAWALSRALGLPRTTWGTPGPLPDVQLRAGRRRDHGEVLATAEPAQSRLDREVALRAGECMGIVSSDRDAALDTARRLVAVARGADTLAPLAVQPRGVPIGRVAAGWERRHGLATGSTLAAAGPLARLDPTRPAYLHSPGERAALTWALSTARPGPRLLVDPTRDLDPSGRRHVARALEDEVEALSVVVSDDVEVLTRACHRLLVVEQHHVVADGAPLAVLDRLEVQPQLSRLGVRALRVRDLVPATGLREVTR
jgi:energy-coupling factor transporter ATP-binding protein EcfA2